MKIFLKFIFLLSLFFGSFLSYPQAIEVSPKTKIYFVKVRLDKMVTVKFEPINKTVDLLSLTVVGPSSKEYEGFEWTETIPYDIDGPKKVFLVHEETAPGEAGILLKNRGKTFEGVALVKEDKNGKEKSEKKDEIPVEIHFPSLKKDQPVYLDFGGVELKRFSPPSLTSSFLPGGADNSILPAVKSFFDFFNLKTLGFSAWQRNRHIPFMANLLHSVDSKEAVDMAFEYDIAYLVWSRSWLKLPGMFDDLLARYSQGETSGRFEAWLWDISSEKAFLAIKEKIGNNSGRYLSLSGMITTGSLAYPQVYDYVFSEYEKLDEERKLDFLRFTFYHSFIYDELTNNFILKEIENVKNKYTKFSDFIRKDELLKNLQKINDIFTERKKQNLYDFKELAAFALKYTYNVDKEKFISGMRLKAEGQIKYNSQDYLVVLVPAGGYKISFKLPLTTEQEALFKDKKAGDTVAFEGIIDDLGSTSNDNEALITLSHVLIPSSGK